MSSQSHRVDDPYQNVRKNRRRSTSNPVKGPDGRLEKGASCLPRQPRSLLEFKGKSFREVERAGLSGNSFGTFFSVEELEPRDRGYLGGNNKQSEPFIWTATILQILPLVASGLHRQRLPKINARRIRKQ
jgi:hypothetical protein